MTYKTIVVHLNDERRAGQIIDVAAGIAERQEAHLIGVFAVPSAVVGAYSRYAASMIEAGRKAYREEAKRIEAVFQKGTAGRSLVAEWRMIEPPRNHPGVAEAVMEHGRAADLIVAAQTDEEWDNHLLLDFPERLALESGRPTLVVPYAGRFTNPGRRILVAWNGTRESARATFDALPLMQAADVVRVLWIDPEKDLGETDVTPTAEIAATLARHGVKCEAAHTATDGMDIGNVLLSRAADFGADMLVMGCYGRSRLREFILGGASRSILGQMTVPVVMSH
jgi:nucleotide-binding universal stress UspA family protein